MAPKRRRPPDPNRPGTVYRSGPRLRRGGLSAGPPFLSQQPADPSTGQRPDQRSGRPVPAGRVGEVYTDDVNGYQPATDPAGVRQPQVYRPAPGQPARPPTRPAPARSRRFARGRALPIAIGVLVLLLIGYPLLLGLTAWTSLHRVDALGPAHRVTNTADTPGRNYLVVGSDSRADLSATERRRLGTGNAVGQRTDTIMLLHLPSGGGPTVLVSIPRDSYVPIPGHGRNKINAAYAVGGAALLVRTVEQVSGIRIDGYVETGLAGFADVVDAIGGIRICPKFDMNDRDAHINLKKGCQQADGRTALGYARARHSDPRGDLGRVERQRETLAAIAGKTLSAGILLQPWRAFPAAKAGGHALTVDNSTTPYGLARFVLGMHAVAGGNGLTLTVPVSNPNLSTPAGSAVGWDKAKATQLFGDLKADDTAAIEPLAKEQSTAGG